ETPDEKAYLSRNNQRVEKQTRAEKRAAFTNAAERETAPTPKPKPKQKMDMKNGSGPSIADLTPKFDWNKVEQKVDNGPKQQASASDDYLKDAESGPQTLLNTREFIYYNYYARIKEKLRQYWEPKIKEKISHIVRQGRQIASDQD